MGVSLADQDVVAHRIDLSALITGDHAGGYARRAHQHGKRRGVVFAESAPGVEQEFIDGVFAEQRRRQGVDKVFIAEIIEHGGDQLPVVIEFAPQFPGTLQRARVVAVGQLQRPLEHGFTVVRAIGRLKPRTHVVAHAAAYRGRAQQLHVARGDRARRPLHRHFKRKQPAFVVRLQGYGVFDGRFPDRQFIGVEHKTWRRPGSAVVIPQHGTAPVQRARFGNAIAELGTKRDGIGQDQAVETARAHAVGKPAEAGMGIVRQAPQRPLDAGKEQEQHQHQGQGLQQQQSGAPRRLAPAGPCPGELHADQHDNQQPGAAEHVKRCCDGLRKQEIGDQQKETEEAEQDTVAQCARFQHLEREHHHEQCDAGITAEQGAVFDQDAGCRCKGQQTEQPFSRGGQAAARQINAPEHDDGNQCSEPQRQSRQMSRRGQQKTAGKTVGFARDDRPRIKRDRPLRHGEPVRADNRRDVSDRWITEVWRRAGAGRKSCCGHRLQGPSASDGTSVVQR